MKETRSNSNIVHTFQSILTPGVICFYTTQELGKETIKKIDNIAATWTAEEKKACVEETGMSFRYSGALMVYLRPPAPELNNMMTYV